MNDKNISEYVTSDWLLFSSQNNLRSLPSFKDGLTTTARKLIFALKDQKEFEVVERLGLVAASKTAYKHGGSSISGALVGMAKSFAGTNNLPIFVGEGQFGTVIDHDASEPRYISARISEMFRHIFKEDDDPILPRVKVRGQEQEYQWMAPVIPMALVNGAFGIGTGYSCNVFQHDPVEVIDAVLDCIEGRDIRELTPSWSGWKGTVIKSDEGVNRFLATGCFERLGATSIRITEVHPFFETNSFREKVLIPLLENNQNVTDFSNDSNEFNGWNITVNFKRGFLSKTSDEEIINMFKLRRAFSHVLNGWGMSDSIESFENIGDLVTDWSFWRLSVYSKRKDFMIGKLRDDIAWAQLKLKFIEMFFSKDRQVPTEASVVALCETSPFGSDAAKKLLEMPVRGLTEEGITKLKASIEKLKGKLLGVTTTTPQEMMVGELCELKELLIK